MTAPGAGRGRAPSFMTSRVRRGDGLNALASSRGRGVCIPVARCVDVDGGEHHGVQCRVSLTRRWASAIPAPAHLRNSYYCGEDYILLGGAGMPVQPGTADVH